MWLSLYPPALFLLQTNLCEATALTVRVWPQGAPGASSPGRVVGGEGSAWGQAFTSALSHREIDLNAVKQRVTDGLARVTKPARVQTFAARVQTFAARVQAFAARVQTFVPQVQAFAPRVQTIAAQVRALTARVAALSARDDAFGQGCRTSTSSAQARVPERRAVAILLLAFTAVLETGNTFVPPVQGNDSSWNVRPGAAPPLIQFHAFIVLLGQGLLYSRGYYPSRPGGNLRHFIYIFLRNHTGSVASGEPSFTVGLLPRWLSRDYLAVSS